MPAEHAAGLRARRRRSASTARTAADAWPEALVDARPTARVARRAARRSPRRRPSGANLELTTVGAATDFPRRPRAPARLPARPPVSRDRPRLRRAPRADRATPTSASTCSSQWIADHGAIVVCDRQPRHAPPRPGLGARHQGQLRHRPARRTRWPACRRSARATPSWTSTRVGIYGWSFGGYMAALAVLRAARRLQGRASPARRWSTGWTTTPTTPSATSDLPDADAGRLPRARAC